MSGSIFQVVKGARFCLTDCEMMLGLSCLVYWAANAKKERV